MVTFPSAKHAIYSKPRWSIHHYSDSQLFCPYSQYLASCSQNNSATGRIDLDEPLLGSSDGILRCQVDSQSRCMQNQAPRDFHCRVLCSLYWKIVPFLNAGLSEEDIHSTRPNENRPDVSLRNSTVSAMPGARIG